MIRTRYRRITWFFARLLISIILWDLLFPRIGLRQLSRKTRSDRLKKAAVSFRLLAIQMGGVLIKVGQFLSSRVDVLPAEIIRELEGLQDEVPPETYTDIRRVIETEFSAPLEDLFSWFEQSPLAAASLGQVHQAKIANPADGSAIGEGPSIPEFCREVVVKVLRPNIEQVIQTDVAALRTVGGWINRYPPIRRRANVPELINEFTRILFQEIDYLSEGRNAETFAANFKDYPGVRVPQVCWTQTTRRVLTLENVFAIKITDYPAIEAAGVRREEVAGRLLDTYLKQIFEDGFFHADPHPGNLFVQPLSENPGVGGSSRREWVLTFVDFGMTGQVPGNLRMGLRELLIGVGLRDSSRVVHGYQMMDMLLPNADLESIERASSQVFDQFWGMDMTELTSVSYHEMKGIADEFGELIYEMPFQVPQNVIFLGRCVGILSGMCTGLDPQFNLWAHLAPFARKIVAEEAGKGWESWLSETGKLARTFLFLPTKLDAALSRLERGDISVRAPEVSQQVRKLARAVRGLAFGLIFSAFLLGGIQLYVAGNIGLAAAAAVIGVIFIFGALASLRLE